MKNNIPPADIRKALDCCCGTSGYHIYCGQKLTDGAFLMARLCEAFWLLDLIISYQVKPNMVQEKLQVWKLELDKGKTSATIICTNGAKKSLAKQEIFYTDFPLPEGITIYKIDKVILLPSEY